MRPRCSVYIATSVDGFIARPDGAIDWLPGPDPVIGDFGYEAFMASVDAVLLGRSTYDLVCTMDGWHYGHRRVMVLSRRGVPVPEAHRGKVTVHAGPPADALASLAAHGCKHVYVDGGVTIQAFLAEGLIDDITITTIPVLLGAGRPLFGALSHDVRLELQSSQSFANGFVQSTWRVAHPVA
ncbi:MAG: dihydrofolate reductase [Gemmatimonadetes bacterium]|nr:dihydrofolate reductase [Gemmatimonadota bacterium]